MRILVAIFSSLMLIVLINKAIAQPKNYLTSIPNQCVVNYKGEACTTHITIKWQLTYRQDVCLLHNDKIIHCVQQTQNGEHAFSFTAEQTSTFKIVEMNTLTELSLFKFNLLYFGKASTKRRKLPWRIL